MRKLTMVALLGSVLVACTTTSPPANDPAALSIDAQEPVADAFLLSNARQLTYQGRRSKEAYFSRDGGRLVFQSEREPDNPFYQTYVLDLSSGNAVRVSTGVGRTTRGFFHPDGHKVLFDSTHDDAQARAGELSVITAARDQPAGVLLGWFAIMTVVPAGLMVLRYRRIRL